MKTKRSKTPDMTILNTLLANGTITRDSTGAFNGLASDGQMVQFGMDSSQVALYLNARPTPDKW